VGSACAVCTCDGARARGVFGSTIKIKYNDYGDDRLRMRNLEGRFHVRVLVNTSRARRAPEKPVVHWPRRGNPAPRSRPLRKVGSAAIKHAHDRCARARTDTRGTATASVIVIVVAPALRSRPLTGRTPSHRPLTTRHRLVDVTPLRLLLFIALAV